VITASELRQDVLRALAAGAHGYLPKTLGIDEIARALSHVLDGHVFVPPSFTDLPSEARVPADLAKRTAVPAVKVNWLTLREREVLRHMATGKSNKEIARALHVTEGTVRTHVYSLFRTLRVHNRVSAVALLRSYETQSELGYSAAFG
jgi:DNA-binding NarL/FixJ family response regulator